MNVTKNVGSEFIMFYNVENLLMADRKPSFRGERGASGLRNWNSWRYEQKLSKILSVFQLFEVKNAQLPVFIGLSEVQGEKPLEEFVNKAPLTGRYGYVHYRSLDERGVDTALLFDKGKAELLSSEPLTFIFEIEDQDPENYDKTRDILHTKFSIKGEIVNIFVCHLPSRREKDVNKPRRDFIMSKLRETVLNLLKKKNEAVIVMGDFNSNPDDEALTNLLYDDERKQILKNPYNNLYLNKKFSTFHYAEGLLYDQIFLSGHFFESSFTLQFRNADIFCPQEISSRDRRFVGRPFRTYAGTRYLGGYSDHFPVAVEFSLR